jgi:hypothetical protein
MVNQLAVPLGRSKPAFRYGRRQALMNPEDLAPLFATTRK